MDVISEIKKFEQHSDRANFSTLQINDFYKNLVGRSFKFEAIISSVKKGIGSDFEIYADTYSYTILHNPVAERDYLNWAPDTSFVCEASKDIFKFNPLTDLIKGDRFHCSAVLIGKENSEIRVKLNSFEKIPFLEIEKEKDILEKKFQNNYEEMTVFAPQRQFQRNTLDKVILFGAIGALIGICLGLFWGCIESFVDDNTSIMSYGIYGALIGGAFSGFIGMIMGILRPRTRR